MPLLSWKLALLFSSSLSGVQLVLSEQSMMRGHDQNSDSGDDKVMEPQRKLLWFLIPWVAGALGIGALTTSAGADIIENATSEHATVEFPKLLAERSHKGIEFQYYTEFFTSQDNQNTEFPKRATLKYTGDLCGDSLCDYGLAVLSDRDDTMYSSGGSWPKGADGNYIKEGIYPGVTEFFKQLGRSKAKKIYDGKVRFNEVSARPGVLSELGHKGHLPGKELEERIDKTYSGNLINSFNGMMSDKVGGSTWVGTALEKGRDIIEAESAREKAEGDKYKERAAVWVGDNGQGDALAALLATDKVLVSFIHVVTNTTRFQGEGQDKNLPSLDPRYNGSSNGIVYFLTYSEASNIAHEIGLLTEEQANEVHEATICSAMGKACLSKGGKCDTDSETNKKDGTCGFEGSGEVGPFLYEDSPNCRAVRDAVEYLGKKRNDVVGEFCQQRRRSIE